MERGRSLKYPLTLPFRYSGCQGRRRPGASPGRLEEAMQIDSGMQESRAFHSWSSTSMDTNNENSTVNLLRVPVPPIPARPMDLVLAVEGSIFSLFLLERQRLSTTTSFWVCAQQRFGPVCHGFRSTFGALRGFLQHLTFRLLAPDCHAQLATRDV
jgi:hypothetical protein